jgi:hypothetical protein
MLEFLNKPYPFSNDLKYNTKVIIFISLGVLAFIFFLRPVDMDTISVKEITYLLVGSAASTFIILSANLVFIPGLFPKQFSNKRWNIKREIIWNAWTLVSTTGMYYLFYSVIFDFIIIDGFDIARIIFLGLIPVSALIIINHNRLLRNHLESARKMNEKLMAGKDKKDELINFESDYKKNTLMIKANSVIMIKSADNYIEVFFEKAGEIKRQLIRNSLRRVETLLSDYEFIIKCHRSFIVNVHHIKEVQGSSQGFRVFFEGIEAPAIVSQKYIDDFKKLI